MENGELQEMLKDLPSDMEVVLRVSGDEAEDGDYLEIEDERSVLVEYGRITIIGETEME